MSADDVEALAATVRDGADPGAEDALISERYTIDGLLGTGGMGAVFSAHDRVLDRVVALKVIRGARDGDAGDRLAREARAMARVSHPNVIQVFDAGVATSGQVYVAMELVEGVTLDRWLRERSADPAAIVATFVAAGRGLAAAHAAGLVHRDFKPENVMVGSDGRVCVLDFGLARAAGAGPDGPGRRDATAAAPASVLTMTGAILGTPRYMSAEQWRGEPTDARTDQFSFCVALAAALAGIHPFDDTSPAAKRDAVLAGTPRLPDTIPSWIEPVLRRGLAHRREERFATMDELIAALQPPAAPRRRSRRAGWVAAAAVASVLGAVALATWRTPAARTPRRAAVPDGGTWLPPDPAPPGPGFRCGPNFQTYAVLASGDSRGVRCVMFARDQDGTPTLAWYGEGVHRGAHYRHLGEGRLGGAGRAAEVIGNGEDSDVPFDDTLHLDPADSGTPPERIAAGGARDEVWIRTDGLHVAYTDVFTDPIRLCGPHLTRYRQYPKVDSPAGWGSGVACVMGGGRAWLIAGAWARDPFMGVGTAGFEDGMPSTIAGSLCLPGRPCGTKRHGRLGHAPTRPRELPGIGTGLEVSGILPELWFPSTRRHAVRIHAVRVVDDASPDELPVTVADVERAVRRANELLASAEIEVFFLADENAGDVETVLRSVTGDSTSAELREMHPYKIIVFFQDGMKGGCAPPTSGDAIALPPPGQPAGCATPWDDRLGHALAAHLGLPEMRGRPMSSDEAARLEARLRELLIE